MNLSWSNKGAVVRQFLKRISRNELHVERVLLLVFVLITIYQRKLKDYSVVIVFNQEHQLILVSSLHTNHFPSLRLLEQQFHRNQQMLKLEAGLPCL